MDRIRSLVRPTVTWGLVAAQIALTGAWAAGLANAEAAFAGLSPFTTFAVTFYFKSREERED